MGAVRAVAGAQEVFRSLSVFAGSFGLADATAVVAGEDGDEFAVLDQVTRLVERSLVNHDGETGRYRLLETLRQFGDDRLVEAGEAEVVGERFADHFCAVAHREGPRMFGAEHDEAKALCDALWSTASVAITAGDIANALALSERARDLIDRHPGLRESGWALHVPVTIAMFTEVPDGEATSVLMAEIAERHGDPHAALYGRCAALYLGTMVGAELEAAVERRVDEAIALESPIWLGTALSLAGAALLRELTDLGDPEAAVVAAGVIRGEVFGPTFWLIGSELEVHENHLAIARSAMGEVAYEAALARGGSMSEDDGFDFLLEEIDRVLVEQQGPTD